MKINLKLNEAYSASAERTIIITSHCSLILYQTNKTNKQKTRQGDRAPQEIKTTKDAYKRTHDNDHCEPTAARP